MIKYEALVNNYYYNNEDIDKVIKLLKDTNYYESGKCMFRGKV